MSDQPTTWRKSSRSSGTANCVEIGRTFDGAAVRDTKDRAGGYFTATPNQWQLFVTAIKTNRFR